MPRRLDVGDRWVYKVVFPDSKSYEFNETVLDLSQANSRCVYTLLRDDAMHFITEYVWITDDWREVKVFQPHIGNLLTNSTVIYNPPMPLLRIPIQIGDSWSINSTAQTTFEFDSKTITTSEMLREKRTVTSLDQVITPAERFNAFKLTVATPNETISEVLWFDTGLGQIVYGEYYNNNEKVTQTMLGYTLSSKTVSLEASASHLLSTDFEPEYERKWSVIVSQVIFTTKLPLFTQELKIDNE